MIRPSARSMREDILAPRRKNAEEAASLMIKRYGRSALHQIDQRIEELRSHGEGEALELWREIRTTAEFLLNTTLSGDSN
jgi:hypothetical protein